MLASKKALIVDDSLVAIEFAKKILREIGINNIIEATDAKTCMELVSAEHPDFVLMDIVMKGVNGFQATRMIANCKTTKNVQVIICSSKANEEDIEWGRRHGAVAHLEKPLNKELLEKTLLSIFEETNQQNQ